MGSPLQLWHHSYIFTLNFLMGFLQGVQPCYIMPALSGLPLKSGWSTRPHNSCIVHICKTTTSQTMQRSVTSSSSSWTHMNHGCSGFWVPGQLNAVNWILGKQLCRWPYVTRVPQRHSFLKGIPFKWVYTFTHWSLSWMRSGQFPLILPFQSSWFIFNGNSFVNNHTHLVHNFQYSSFLSRLNVFQILPICFFAPDSCCVSG